jgi:hypothetical protein
MIPSQWYAILESDEVKRGRPLAVTRLGEKLVLWRDAPGQVTCMRNLCPHRGVALPHVRDAATLILPGTPVTFQRFTHRAWGWVGGFPQTSLFRAWGPRLSPGLWMVGDSIFPGQSTAAVALGGLRVADSVLAEAGLRGRRATWRDGSRLRSKGIGLSKTSIEKA